MSFSSVIDLCVTFVQYFSSIIEGRSDFSVPDSWGSAQKVTELGTKLIWPVITERTQYKNIKQSKILSNTIEAAEQCGLTFILI